MQSLEALTREARALAGGGRPPSAPEAEVARQMQICNACRYCEGYCAVFPAMTRRLEFEPADVHFLANLCHNCGACLHACQYAPPHEFAVNVPQAMARVRARTYTDFAWPRGLGALYRNNGMTVALALAGGLALFLILAVMREGELFQVVAGGNFYAIFPHNLLLSMFAPVFLFAALALGIGVARFWREVSPGAPGGAAIAETTTDVLRLKYLDGGHGQGCSNASDASTLWRRRFHHLSFYGFMLSFAATCVATLYHYLFGWEAPYAYTSLPVLLGIAGGIGLVIGPIGLLRLNLTRHADHGDAAQKPMDRAFILLLLLTGASGLALLAGRETSAMAVLLALHLGAVMAFFLTMPYGKFAHGVYRGAALLKWAVEKRLPTNLRLGGE